MEKPGAEIRRKILACVHVEEDSRRAEYGTLHGSLSEETTNSGFPTGSLQRRASLSFRYTDHKTGETATETLTQRELVARLKQHIPEKFLDGEVLRVPCQPLLLKLPQVYRALGMDKPEPVAKVLCNKW